MHDGTKEHPRGESSVCSREEYARKYPLAFVDRGERDKRVSQRYCRAWQVARKAAKVLKDSFEASRVVAFGSLTDRDQFSLWSDIDIAAWGIPAERFYAAVGAVTGLSSEFKIDLVAADCDELRESLKDHITREGIAL